MNDLRFALLIKTLMDSGTRRRVLGGVTTLAPVGLLMSVFSTESAASIRRHRVHEQRKKRKKQPCQACPTCPPPQPPPTPPPVPPPLTCAQSCPGICASCYIRLGAPAQCGDSAGIACTRPCSSDADCAGFSPPIPYCVAQVVNRATGVVSSICPTPGAFCIDIDKCS